MKTKLLFSLTVILAAFCCASPQASAKASSQTSQNAPLNPANREALLHRLQKTITAHPSLEGDFHEQRTTPLLTKPLISNGTLAFQTPDKFRREVKGESPSITVSDGKTMWIYYPKFHTAERYPIGKQKMFDAAINALVAGFNLQHTEKYYHVTAYQNGDTYRLHLTPKKSSVKRVLKSLDIWIDRDFNPIKSDYISPKGDRILTTYTHMRRTPLPASFFEFKPPANAQISTPLGK